MRRLLSGAAVVLLATVLCATGVPSSATATDSSAFNATKTVTRTTIGSDGKTSTDSRPVTVTADVTKDLRGRQSVTIGWSGARPSGNINGAISDPAAFTSTEYPVVVLQCRGTAATVDPSTCWTTSLANSERQLANTDAGAGGAIYQHDALATPAQKAVSIPSADQWTADCSTNLAPGSTEYPYVSVPFVAADGTQYWGCGGTHDQPPEAGYATPTPANERVVGTATDGTGTVTFEVRSAAENASLGCSSTVVCSIVVIPIMGVSCGDDDTLCNQAGVASPGSVYSDQQQVARAVTAKFWASPSNWANRITVPITFAVTDTTCDLNSSQSTLQLYGSSLISEAAAQWAPAYCTNPKRFRLQINDQPEGTAFTNLVAGFNQGVVATFPTTNPKVTTPLGYTPIAVSGFAVAFMIDLPDGTHLTSLKLNARLLAKLMTGSYPGFVINASYGRPDLVKNPTSLQNDPEFVKLNPTVTSTAAWWSSPISSLAVLLGPNVPSDLMESLTEYIASDSDAMAFINGAADPWGMTVNAAYKDTSMPRNDWPLADTWAYPNPNKNTCPIKLPTAWFSRLMAPVGDWHRIAQDLLTGTPEQQIYNEDPVTGCSLVRAARQYPGAQRMIALVTIADAKLYGLPTASLQTTSGNYVAPSTDSMAAAASVATQSGPGQPYEIDQTTLKSHPDAYPGTMVLHAAVPLSGLSATDAANAASFIAIATSEGQVPGGGVGQLPAGYLPITSVGSTAALYRGAQTVAAAIASQTPFTTPTAAATPAATTAPAAATTTDNVVTTTGSSAPVSSQVLAAGTSSQVTVQGKPAPAAAATAAPARGTTAGDKLSGPVRGAIPGGIGLALAAGIALPFARTIGRRKARQ